MKVLDKWYKIRLIEFGNITYLDSFDHYWDLKDCILKLLKNGDLKNCVYLYNYSGLENPIIVSCNYHHILNAISNNAAFREHSVELHKSYKEAYNSATYIMREHKLSGLKKDVLK